jgi:hypothetical protein
VWRHLDLDRPRMNDVTTTVVDEVDVSAMSEAWCDQSFCFFGFVPKVCFISCCC